MLVEEDRVAVRVGHDEAPRPRARLVSFLNERQPGIAQGLEDAPRKFLAWKSIVAESETLNLSGHQRKQAEAQLKTADGAVKGQIPEAYQWLLVPTQKSPQAPVVWQAQRLWGMDHATCERVLMLLVTRRVLKRSAAGTYLRAR